MWKSYFSWSIRRPALALLGLLLVLSAGVYTAPFNWSLGFERAPVPASALPDTGEHQQIVFTSWPGYSAQEVEDHITQPLSSHLLGLRGVETLRASSTQGFSSIHVIFADSVHFGEARTTLSQELARLDPQILPRGVSPRLGPDANALGQVFWYTVQAFDLDSGKPSDAFALHELRDIQDRQIRPALKAVPGVAEVASVGGYVSEYQVEVDRRALRAHGITLEQITHALRNSNLDIGARTLEINHVEYAIRSRGRLRNQADLENSVVAERGAQGIRLADVARVRLGPGPRRGALDLAGHPATGGVVVVRYGENPRAVIDKLKAEIAIMSQRLPSRKLRTGGRAQVRLVPVYDRSELIDETLDTLSDTLGQQLLISLIVVLGLMGSLRASGLISASLPLAVLLCFVAMKLSGVTAHVMALAGIAIAIGSMVDMAIIFVENIQSQLERDHGSLDPRQIVAFAAAEVAPAVFTSLCTTVLSFLPILALDARELKVFAPLLLTKSYAMCAAFVLALLVLPVFAGLWLRRAPREPLGIFSWLGPLSILGAALAVAGDPIVSALLTVLGLLQLLKRHGVRHTWLQLGLRVLWLTLPTILLARAWAPLGVVGSEWANLGVVALLVAVSLVGYHGTCSIYPDLLRAAMARRPYFMLAPVALILFSVFAWLGAGSLTQVLPSSWQSSSVVRKLERHLPGLGHEYMPAFDEGSFLLMPTTAAHVSIAKAQDLLEQLDRAVARVPEVKRVVGKIGRVESALDPAPIAMFESLVELKPEYGPDAEGRLHRQWRPHVQSTDDIWRDIAAAARIPGLSAAPKLMPIAARAVMLQTGLRAPLGLALRGPKTQELSELGRSIERELLRMPEIRSGSVYVETTARQAFVDIEIDRQALVQYGLAMATVQRSLRTAIAGTTVTQIIEGRQRRAVRVQYPREDRNTPTSLAEISIARPGGGTVPLAALAKIDFGLGPQVIKTENTLPTCYLSFDAASGESLEHTAQAVERRIRQALADGRIILPPDASIEPAGAYLDQLRSQAKLRIAVPLALLVIFGVLYLQFRRASTVFAVFFGVAVALSGGFTLIWLYGQPWFLASNPLGIDFRQLLQVEPTRLSTAVWVGFIALIGIATDDGVLMSTHIDNALRASRPRTTAEIREVIINAAQRRLRPCLMTSATTILALLPVISSQARGADIMRTMALPSLGGMLATLLTVFVVPVLSSAGHERALQRRSGSPP